MRHNLEQTERLAAALFADGQRDTLARLLRRPHDGIVFNEHYSGEGAIIYKHACALGCEGVVSKRLG